MSAEWNFCLCGGLSQHSLPPADYYDDDDDDGDYDDYYYFDDERRQYLCPSSRWIKSSYEQQTILPLSLQQ
jgi:hypothetical protein